MHRIYVYMLTALIATPLVIGCGGETTTSAPKPSDTSTTDAGHAPTPRSKSRTPWWTLAINKARDALGYSLEVVHDGTGWILGKATVNIEQIGDSRDGTNGKLADFRITVTSSDESFTSEVKNVPCDEFGIPDEDAQTKFDEAVEKIKEMLAKLQS